MSPLFGGGSDREAEGRPRSADERERARAEREARRAAREGRAPRELPPRPDDPTRVAVQAAEPDVVTPAPVADAAETFAPHPVGHEPEPETPAPETAIHQPVPAAYEPEPVAYEPEPVAYEPAPAAHEPEPAVYDPASAVVEPEPVAHEPEPVAPEPEPVAHEPLAPAAAEPAAYEPAPAAADPEPVAYEAAPAAYEPEPVAHAPAAEPEPHAPGTAAHEALHEPTAEGHEPGWETEDHPAVVVRGRTDQPAGVKRVAASAMASAAGAEAPPRFGAPPRGVPKRRRGLRRVLPVGLLLLLLLVGFFLFRLYQPGTGDGGSPVAVTIPAGSSAEDIGKLLAKQHVVASSFFFGLRARLDGGNLRSGKVSLRRDMSYAAALTELKKQPKPAPVLAKITIPEGPSRREVAPLVKKAGFTGSYVAASRHSKELDPRDFGAPKGASLEGFLFPATYQLKPGSSAKALVTQQLAAFKRTFAQVDMSVAKRRKLTRFDVLTIASMIEREAGVAKDRPLIAAVIYNRLKQGMPLGIDATTRYAVGNFTSPLKVSELKSGTPYDTRYRVGLPIGPIGNPGLASIRAAAHPAHNDYLFYVVKPCGKGAHAFSSTDAQFQRDSAAYNAKRQALGGKDPSQC